ncbi:MAG: hypothetical protein V4508_03695 [Pseudomonadota bacterium]
MSSRIKLAPPLSARQALYCLLAAAGVLGIGAAAASAIRLDMLWLVCSDILISFLGFVWFCRDSDAHAYPRSRWLKFCMIFMVLLAVPYYLARSRPAGAKLRAVLRFLGFLLLGLLVSAIGSVFGVLLAP